MSPVRMWFPWRPEITDLEARRELRREILAGFYFLGAQHWQPGWGLCCFIFLGGVLFPWELVAGTPEASVCSLLLHVSFQGMLVGSHGTVQRGLFHRRFWRRCQPSVWPAVLRAGGAGGPWLVPVPVCAVATGQLALPGLLLPRLRVRVGAPTGPPGPQHEVQSSMSVSDFVLC